MALTAQDEEILTGLCGNGLGAPALAVLDDVSLRFELATGPAGAGRIDSGGMWVGHLRRISAAKLRHWRLPSLADSAELLISELVTNALKHGTGHEIAFRLVLTADLLLILVDDRSPGRPQVRETSPTDEGGRGLFLVETIALAWGVSLDETCTWCALATHADRRSR